MSDREKVIKGLRDIDMFIAGRLGYEKAKNYLRTIDEAIVLLKEQEAVEPTIDEYGNKRCRSCGHKLQSIADQDLFCCKCGKPVLWEGR